MPALLVAVLSTKDKALFEKTFPRVIDNGKMLRNFVQIMRSGAVGRKSLGSLPKRMVREWFETRNAESIFKQSVGQSPSFADVLKMVHPKPKDAENEALYGYFIGREINADKLPEIVKTFRAFQKRRRFGSSECAVSNADGSADFDEGMDGRLPEMPRGR